MGEIANCFLKTACRLDCDIWAMLASSSMVIGELSFAISPKNFTGKTYYYKANVDVSGVSTTALRYRCNLPEFKLWWPNGYGDQNLYNLTVKFVAEDGSVSSSYNVFIAKGAKTDGHFEIYTNNGSFILYSPEFGTVDLGLRWSNVGSDWHHLAFVWENNNISSYVDGVKKNTVSVLSSVNVTETVGDISIGALNDGTLPFNGMIDNVALYTKALAAAEIAVLAESTEQPYVELSGNDVGKSYPTDFVLENGKSIQLWFNAGAFGTG